ncbi:MAG: DUF4105 domain-containing protein [Prevotella sp.]|nr:DUF4105 domain-containing protein [Prevotella sp.]
MRRRFLLSSIALLFAFVPMMSAEEVDAIEIQPDSSNYVIASIVLSSPGEEAFFALGHSGLRLQCPSKGLDFCFSYSTIVPPGPEFNLLLLFGQMKGGFEALPYDEYMDTFRQTGRGVIEYPLNLTLNEKRELWRLMDNKMMLGPTLPFDFLYNNCTSTLYHSLESVMEREDFVYPRLSPLDMRVRDAFHVLFADAPWIEFFGITMLSAIPPDDPCPLELVLCPSLWARLLPEATIVGIEGSSRPALSGEPFESAPQTLFIEPSIWTPVFVFALLLLVAVVVTLVEHVFRWKRVGAVFDGVLFTFYNLFAFYMLYASCVGMFGYFWNWFFFVFNPLPLLLWLYCRKKGGEARLWLGCSVVLIAFMLFYIVHMSQFEWPHELLLATLLLRCLNRYFAKR